MVSYIYQTPQDQYESMIGNNMAAVISLTLLFVEYFQTLELEVELVWPAPWNSMKFLYFANRILPFLVVPFVLVYNLITEPNPKLCIVVFSIPWVGITICILLSEAILYVRLYALSGHARWTLIVVLVNGAAIFIACSSLLVFYLIGASWDPSEFEGEARIRPGCIGKSRQNGHLVTIGYGFLFYSVFATMVLCLYFGLRLYWSSRRSPLLKIFYRDGTFYFVVLAVMSVANGVVANFLPSGFRFVLSPLQAVMHSTLSIRMILHLRDQARCQMGLSTARRMVCTEPAMEFLQASQGREDEGPFDVEGRGVIHNAVY